MRATIDLAAHLSNRILQNSGIPPPPPPRLRLGQAYRYESSFFEIRSGGDAVFNMALDGITVDPDVRDERDPSQSRCRLRVHT